MFLYCALGIRLISDLLRFQAKILKFIWCTKGHRLAGSTLFTPRSRGWGGLGVPDLYAYYKAAQLMQLSIVFSHHKRPDWVWMERQAISSFRIDFLLWRPLKKRPLILSPTLSHSFGLWDRLLSSPLLTSTFTTLSHIFHNPDFPSSMDIGAFKWWKEEGLYRTGYFFTYRGPFTPSHCSSVLEMPQMEWFSFYQIAHFLCSIWW